VSEKTTKEVAFETGGKIVISVIGLVMLKNFVGGMFSEPGLTTRVKFNYDNTQKRKIYVGGSTEWYEIDDPWKPDDLAHRLHSTMSGWLPEGDDALLDESDRADAWREVAALGIDRARWLHNYWLDKIDSEDTVYRWIDSEWANVPEWDTKDSAMSMLTRAGVGW